MTRRQQAAMFWALFAATTLVYVIMVFWSLPKISAMAGGQMPFDLRPMGYSLEEARNFLGALSDEGRAFYLGTQHSLDTLYPPLLAATLGLGSWIMSPASSRLVRMLLSGLAVPGMGFDLAENHAVSGLLAMPVAAIDAEAVMIASALTALKSLFTTIAMTTLLVLTLAWAWRRWKRPA
jgi:hypothetical protein